jgi:aerotolerance regulator-like protein
MNFLFPGVLWALPLVAVPIIIHLLNRQRYQRVDFGAMEFLRRAIRRTRRRVLLEDIILLLLRTLAALFLIVGLAGPTLGPDSLLGNRPPQAEILVLDYSMSMNRRVDNIRALDRSIGAMQARLAQLDPNRGDRAALILAGDHASRPAFGNPAEVRLVLDEIDLAPASTAALAQALEIARKTAETLETDSGLNPRITVYSDLQASSWNLESSVGETLQRLAAQNRPLQILDSGRPGPNTTVNSLVLTPNRLTTGDPTEVRATVRRYGPPTTVRATLLLDGNPVRTERLDLADSEEVVFRHLLQPAESGSRSVALQLDSDQLNQDDQRQAILHVQDALPTLLVGEAATGQEPDRIFDSLERYLNLGDRGPLSLQPVAPQRLRAQLLAQTSILVLADPESLSGTAIAAIHQFVLAGGGLLLIPGPDFDPTLLTELLTALDAAEILVDSPRTAENPNAHLTILEPGHPAVQLFLDPRWTPLLTEVPHSRYRPISTPTGDPRFHRILRFHREGETDLDLGDALVTWKVGAGQVALLTAAPLARWNMMDQVSGGSLPFLLDLALSLAPRSGHADQILVGEELAIELPAPPTSVQLIDPDGRPSSPLVEAQTLAGGRVRLPLLNRTPTAGTWQVQATLLENDGLEVKHLVQIAVNPPSAESDPAVVDLVALQTALPEGSVLIGPDNPEAQLSLEKTADTRLDTFFFALLAACLLLETLLAAILDRRRG